MVDGGVAWWIAPRGDFPDLDPNRYIASNGPSLDGRTWRVSLWNNHGAKAIARIRVLCRKT